MKTLFTRPPDLFFVVVVVVFLLFFFFLAGDLYSVRTLIYLKPQYYNQDVIHAWWIDKTDRFLVFHCNAFEHILARLTHPFRFRRKTNCFPGASLCTGYF